MNSHSSLFKAFSSSRPVSLTTFLALSPHVLRRNNFFFFLLDSVQLHSAFGNLSPTTRHWSPHRITWRQWTDCTVVSLSPATSLKYFTLCPSSLFSQQTFSRHLSLPLLHILYIRFSMVSRILFFTFFSYILILAYQILYLYDNSSLCCSTCNSFRLSVYFTIVPPR